MKWKFREVDSSLIGKSWNDMPNNGISGLFSPTTAQSGIDAEGYRFFFATKNPVSVSESYSPTTKELNAINNEIIQVETFKTGDNKTLTKYNIKFEYQSELVYQRIKFLYKNNKEFYLFNNENISNPNVKKLYLKINTLDIDQVALKGEVQLYGFTLSCTDVESDSSLTPTRYRFEELSAGSWAGTYSGTSLRSSKEGFLSDFAPVKFDEQSRQKGTVTETINGTTVKIFPLRINPSNNAIERIGVIKALSLDFNYQKEAFKHNVYELLQTQDQFNLYLNASGTIQVTTSNPNNTGFVLEDISNCSYVGNQGNEVLYNISLVVREII